MLSTNRFAWLGLVYALLWASTGARAGAGSPVADAAMRGDASAVRALLQRGADVNAAQGDGMTALHWAAEHGDHDLAAVLLESGANPGAETRIGRHTPLHVAPQGGHHLVVRTLLQNKAGAFCGGLGQPRDGHDPAGQWRRRECP
ncbi:MAG: hypothetical protein DMF97_04195 [Acidobacteria bacterium]|nr:MAG: hypothetical protein DMF97_04195 [Acidobacteriota bacterium]